MTITITKVEWQSIHVHIQENKFCVQVHTNHDHKHHRVHQHPPLAQPRQISCHSIHTWHIHDHIHDGGQSIHVLYHGHIQKSKYGVQDHIHVHTVHDVHKHHIEQQHLLLVQHQPHALQHEQFQQSWQHIYQHQHRHHELLVLQLEQVHGYQQCWQHWIHHNQQRDEQEQHGGQQQHDGQEQHEQHVLHHTQDVQHNQDDLHHSQDVQHSHTHHREHQHQLQQQQVLQNTTGQYS